MENSNQLDELLIRYLIGELNTDEEAFVVNWINANEENLHHFEALKNTWQLTAVKLAADHINIDDEWELFRKAVSTDNAKVVSIDRIKEAKPVSDITSDDDYEEPGNKRPLIYRVMIAVAVAASILLVVGLDWNWFTSNKQETPVAQETKTPAEEPLATLRHEVNTSGKARTLMLEDGSQVVLWDKSEISFAQPFPSDQRRIMLKGKADFKVAKDRSRPFTVFSGDISTTALGTEFTVTAYEQAANITVRLYEGRVVVKSVDSIKHKLKKDYYLQPGQELVYDNKRITARVRTFGKNNIAEKEGSKEDVISDNPDIPKKPGTWYMFNNQPLDQVFQQLSDMYNAEIQYSKKDVQKMYFIGDFDKSDSLEHILKQIAVLNNLTVTRQDNGYIIKK